MRTRRFVSFAVGLGVVLGASMLGVAPAGATTSGGLRFAVTLGARDVTTSTGSHPIRLDPTDNILLGLTVTNTATQAVDVNAVRLEGEVGGVTFFSYQVAVDMPLAPGATDQRQVTVNLDGLQKQATGLLAGRVQLLTTHNKVLASVAMITDVRGSAVSTYAVCGIVVALLTLLGFLSAIVALAQHKLPPNRFVRAARFGVPALGAGVFVVFLLSAFRVIVPRTTSGVPIVLVAAAIGFGLGYMTPTPIEATEHDYDDDAADAGDVEWAPSAGG